MSHRSRTAVRRGQSAVRCAAVSLQTHAATQVTTHPSGSPSPDPTVLVRGAARAQRASAPQPQSLAPSLPRLTQCWRRQTVSARGCRPAATSSCHRLACPPWRTWYMRSMPADVAGRPRNWHAILLLGQVRQAFWAAGRRVCLLVVIACLPPHQHILSGLCAQRTLDKGYLERAACCPAAAPWRLAPRRPSPGLPLVVF